MPLVILKNGWVDLSGWMEKQDLIVSILIHERRGYTSRDEGEREREDREKEIEGREKKVKGRERRRREKREGGG